MSEDETPPPRGLAENTIDEVVERTRRMLRKSRDLLQSSRDLLSKVQEPSAPKAGTPPVAPDADPDGGAEGK
jgi:hypothetical protein